MDRELAAVIGLADVARRSDRVAVLGKRLGLVVDDLGRLEDVVVVLVGGDVADRGAVGRPQRIAVMELRPLVVVRVVRVDILAFDLGEVVFGVAEFVNAVERV